MGISRNCVVNTVLFSVVAAAIPTRCFGLAITPGSDTTAALGNIANAIVQVSDPGGRGTGSILQISPYNGGVDMDVLTADHVVRNSAGGGSTIYAPNQINITFGNGAGTATFPSMAAATDFTIPEDGSSYVDLAMLDVFVPQAQLNMLPANLAPVALPAASPAAGTALTQAGYGLQASIVNVSGNLAYANSTVKGYGAPYGTLKAGPNSINAAGVTAITGALSDYPGGVDAMGNPVAGNFAYQYDGFQNGCLINGANPNYNGSTSYIFSGDSGGPSLTGNTILGVHSSSVTGTLVGDANSQFAYPTTVNANYLWQDVSVGDNLPWINQELATLSPVPEPTSAAILLMGSVGLMARKRKLGR
jgi:hypothetical protein